MKALKALNFSLRPGLGREGLKWEKVAYNEIMRKLHWQWKVCLGAVYMRAGTRKKTRSDNYSNLFINRILRL